MKKSLGGKILLVGIICFAQRPLCWADTPGVTCSYIPLDPPNEMSPMQGTAQCTDDSGKILYRGALTFSEYKSLQPNSSSTSVSYGPVSESKLASAVMNGMPLYSADGSTKVTNPFFKSSQRGSTASSFPGTQLACGTTPDRQTTVIGNNFKISGNGILMYNQSTGTAADTANSADVSSAPVAGGKLQVPGSGVSKMEYIKYSQKLGWLNCPLDGIETNTALINQLVQTDKQDSLCSPISSQKLTSTADPKHPDPSKDNQQIGNMTFGPGNSANASPCDANDMSCPVKPSITDPQGMSFKVGSDGNLTATVNCPDAYGGHTIAQSFVQNIGSGSTPSTKTSINAGKTTPTTP
jgi:hypothetical protein